MTTGIQRAVAVWLLALSLFAPRLSHAAPAATLSSPNGIKVGEGRVHPYFDLETRYDSAVGFLPSGAAGTSVSLVGEAIAHFRPGLRLELSTPSTQVDFDGNVDYLLYTGLLSPGSQAYSRLHASVSLGTAFNKSGVVEFQLGDRFVRSDRSTDPALGIGVLSTYNQATLGLPIRPGGGALEIVPSGSWTIELFEALASTTLLPPTCPDAADPKCNGAINNYSSLAGSLEARWRFLPKTAFILGASLDSRTYLNGGGAPTLLMKATGGLAGLISPKVSTVLKAGWSQDFGATAATAAPARTVIGQAEIGYLMSETANVRLGYARTLQPIAVYGAYSDDRGYLEANLLFGGRLKLHAGFGVDYLSYLGTGAGQSALLVTGDVGPEYQLTAWLFGALGYNVQHRSGDSPYTRHEGIVRLTFTY